MESMEEFSHSFVGCRILNKLVLSPYLSKPINEEHISYYSLLHVNAATFCLLHCKNLSLLLYCP